MEIKIKLEEPKHKMIEFLPEVPKESGYQCFHCLHNTVYWESDFSFEDYGMEGEGIVHVCHCANCDADIEYYVPV